MILTEIGEVGVHLGDQTYVLRPSLYAMSQLGEPSGIVEIYASLMSEPVTLRDRREQFRNALAVVHACSDTDLSDVFGYINERMKYVVKKASMNDVLVLGRHLIQHGITGVLPPLPRRHDDDGEYSDEFNARDHVATAVAHLGMSERDAWNMTMTSLVGALRSKYPPAPSNAPGSRAPSAEEHDATMEWHDRILAKKRAKLNKEQG